MEEREIKRVVKDRYARLARRSLVPNARASCCETSAACCCETPELAGTMGYSVQEIVSAPEGANMGLGCGNPQAVASLTAGETVLDLGSGAGFDCFLSAARVGPTGRVIGVDMTEDMVARARANAAGGEYANVEFRLGEIESLPVDDDSIDVIISNCVINLCPDKAVVLAEAFRVLRPGGRLAVSDVVALGDVPDTVREDPDLYSACVAGAVPPDEYAQLLKAAGFTDIRIDISRHSSELVSEWSDEIHVEEYAASASITARKPR